MTNPTSAQVIVGGTDLATLTNAVDLNDSQVVVATNAARPDRFWSTAKADVNDTVSEALEISYASSGITNQVSFDAAHFPQTITIEYSPDATNSWQPLLDSVTGQPLEIEIYDSYPLVLPNPATVIGHVHPQHDYDGHWVRYELTCDAVEVQKLRFILQRNGGTGPVDTSGNPVPYSLGLQNIDSGYSVSSEDDIPFYLDEAESQTSGAVFANSADIFGSTLGFSKKTYKASNLIYNTDDDAPLLWKSEPQPYSNAVVNFYADMRDSNGHGQIINRIFIDPLYLGCSINLYYSNDNTSAQFESSRTGMSSSQVNLNGATVSTDGPLDLGTWHPATTNPAYFDPYYAQIDNFELGFDPSIDWWIGMEWTRPWAINTDNLYHILFACDAFTIGSDSNNFYLITAAGDTAFVPNNTTQNEAIQIVAGYRNGQLYLSVLQGTTYDDDDNIVPNINTISFEATSPIESVLPPQLILGADPSLSVFTGGTISSFILSQSTLTDDVAADFQSNPSAYSLVPTMPRHEKKSKYWALLRFDTRQLSTANPTGFIGGAAHPFENMTWTPIPRTYEMQRGEMRLPTTKARFWNLEISNLRPEANDKFVPVTRTVKQFPASLYRPQPATAATTRQSADDLPLQVQQDLSTVNTYLDEPQYVGTGDTLNGITNTQVYVADDYLTAQRLAAAGGNEWKYEQFHPERTARRFSTISKHVYIENQVTQTSNVSFFCGLRQIRFSRTVYRSPQDYLVLENNFLDNESIDTGNWQSTDNGLISGASNGNTLARITSVAAPTLTGLRGLQFAVQQSDAQLIDLQGNFSDADYDPDNATSWTAVGDANVFGLDYNAAIGQSALLISRDTGTGYWGSIVLNWGTTYGDIEANDVNYGDFHQGTLDSSNQGGVQSQSISAPYGGRLHAAARVTASQTLDAPIYVQIVDTDTGAVLAEAPSNILKNEVKQWYASIDLSTFGAYTGDTWANLTGDTIYPSFSDSFNRPAATSLGQMDSGQFWSTPFDTASLVGTGTAASVSAAGQQSTIDLQDPWGILSLRFSAVTTTTTHSASSPLIDLGGLYLMSDGTFVDPNESVPLGSLAETISTSHDYNFKFIPTASVVSIHRVSGTDPASQPYSISISTGTLGSDTWLCTITSSRAFTTARTLMGPVGTAFTKFNWTPGAAQINVNNFLSCQPSLDPSNVIDTAYNTYSMTDFNTGHVYYFDGQYTYGVDPLGLVANAQSVSPGGAIVYKPTNLTASAQTSGGSFAAGTYYYQVTTTNAHGETTGATEVSQAVVAGGTITLTWDAMAGAVNYNIYRGNSSGAETYLGSSGGQTTYIDLGNVIDNVGDTVVPPPAYNTSNGGGSRMVTDVKDDFGYFRFNVTQMPSNMNAADVTLAFLDYNSDSGNDAGTGTESVMTLRGDGRILDEASQTVLASISSFNPLAGPITFYYANTQLLTDPALNSLKANPTAIIIFQNNTRLAYVTNSNPTTWTSTVRGIGGANNGLGVGHYTIIEGFNWNPDASALATNNQNITWAEVDYNSSRTYKQMSRDYVGSTENLSLRVIQRGLTQDAWYLQSAEFFWDPVVWEFSCDNGNTYWEAIDIRNNPNGVLMFPYNLTDYNHLKWRLTSYAGDVLVSHLAIRPWYVGQHGYAVPAPHHLPQGPNVIAAEEFAPIELDPRWMMWDNPVPHWWWNQGTVTTT